MNEREHPTLQDRDAENGTSIDGLAPSTRPAETDGKLRGWIMGFMVGLTKVVLVILAIPTFMVGGVLLIHAFDDGCPAGTKAFLARSGSIVRSTRCAFDPGSAGAREVKRLEREFARELPGWAEWPSQSSEVDIETYFREQLRTSLNAP